MKYFLAINNISHKEIDKCDQFSIIDLASFGDYENTIESISNFTGKYSSEEELLSFLLKNSKITNEQMLNKHLVVCYKGIKSKNDPIGCWKKMNRNGITGILLNGNNDCLKYDSFERELLSNELFIPEFINLNECANSELIKFNILKNLYFHLTNDPIYSHYKDNFEACYRNLATYLNLIEKDHIVNSEYFYRPMKTLAKILSYEKRVNKDGTKYVLNTTKLFRFLLYYFDMKQNTTNKLVIKSKKEDLIRQKEELIKVQENINSEIDRLTFEEENQRKKKKESFEQTKLF